MPKMHCQWVQYEDKKRKLQARRRIRDAVDVSRLRWCTRTNVHTQMFAFGCSHFHNGIGTYYLTYLHFRALSSATVLSWSPFSISHLRLSFPRLHSLRSFASLLLYSSRPSSARGIRCFLPATQPVIITLCHPGISYFCFFSCLVPFLFL